MIDWKRFFNSKGWKTYLFISDMLIIGAIILGKRPYQKKSQ